MQAESVLRRKAGAGRQAPGAQGGGVEKAFRIGLAKAAQAVPPFRVDIAGLTEEPRSLAELLEMLPDQALLAIIEGPGGVLGLVAFDQSLLSALIEAMTTGRIGAAAPEPRRPTRTDAAMAAGLIDRILQAFEAELVDAQDRAWAGGFRYASYLESARPLELLLEDKPHRLFQADLRLGTGERKGRLLAAMPAHPHPVATAADRAVADGDAATHGTSVEEPAAMIVPVELVAVLDRLELPLSEVLKLEPGMTLPLPGAAIDAIGLEGSDGRQVSQGKLGQNRGSRAVRLCAPRDEADEGDAGPALNLNPMAAPAPMAMAPETEEEPDDMDAMAAPLAMAMPEIEDSEEDDDEVEPLPFAMAPMPMTG